MNPAAAALFVRRGQLLVEEGAIRKARERIMVARCGSDAGAHALAVRFAAGRVLHSTRDTRPPPPPPLPDPGQRSRTHAGVVIAAKQWRRTALGRLVWSQSKMRPACRIWSRT